MDAVGGGGGGGEGRPADRRSQVSGIRQCRKAATKKGSGSNERWLRGSELIRLGFKGEVAGEYGTPEAHLYLGPY